MLIVFELSFGMYNWNFKLSTEESGFVQSKTTNGGAEKKKSPNRESAFSPPSVRVYVEIHYSGPDVVLET